MANRPTILIVPGSFVASTTVYKELVDTLRGKGYPALAVQLPSTQKRMPLPPATMKDDADVIKRAAEMLISQGKEVVVLAHSYGGTPTTQALAGVPLRRIIYLSAMVPKLGQSQTMTIGMPDGVLPMEATDGYMHIDPIYMAGAICNDLPWDVAYEHALNFPHHSGPSFLDQVDQVAYKDVPVSYIVCENDLVVKPEVQRRFVGVLEEEGRKVEVLSLQSGHCPMWSVLGELVNVVVGEAGRE